MAIRGTNLAEEFPWTSEHDDGVDPTPENPNPENPKTIWHFGGIDATVRTHIIDNEIQYSVGQDGSMVQTNMLGRRNVELVRHMLRRVENYYDPAGKPIALELEEAFLFQKQRKIVPDTFISTIPVKVLNEIGGMLVRRLTQTGEQAKNSKTP